MVECCKCKYANDEICGNEDSILYGERLDAIIDGCSRFVEKDSLEHKEIANALLNANDRQPVDNVELAIDVIKGYCMKHVKCEGCPKYKDNTHCYFEIPPCEW